MSFSSNISVVITQPPSLDLEASELALALAAFDLPVQLIMRGMGITWLLPQESRKPNGKAAHKVLAACPLYGIERVYCTQEDLDPYFADSATLPSFVYILNNEALAKLISNSQACFTF